MRNALGCWDQGEEDSIGFHACRLTRKAFGVGTEGVDACRPLNLKITV